MKIETFQYTENKGWSVNKFPDLDSGQTLILVFAAPEYIDHPGPIKELAKFYPQAKMIGCSTGGEILGSRIYDNSISVAVIRFEKATIKIVKTPIEYAQQANIAGAAIAESLADNELKSIFVLSKGTAINGTKLVNGLNKSRNSAIITGGLAGDRDKFKQTWVIFNGDILIDYVVAVGFYSKYIHVGHGSHGGWDSFGLERLVTRSENNILYELDNKPALAIYKEYLGNRAAGLPASGLLYPLSIRQHEADTKRLVRTMFAVNEKEQAVIFSGEIPQGYLAQLMRGNLEHLITGASEAEKVALANLTPSHVSEPMLSIAVSCVGRRVLLGTRSEEETEIILQSLPPTTKQIGFYSYGELAPHSEGDCDFHNQTMTMTLICEH